MGLGNPGPEYAATRHNLGFRVVEELARRLGLDLVAGECNSAVGRQPGDALVLAQPHTYMNRSGFAARCLVERYDFAIDDMLVVYDEVALPLGRLRLRPSGSPAGHRGLESVIHELRSDEIPRLRLGIAPSAEETSEGEAPVADLVEFVLEPFRGAEEEVVGEMVTRAADACQAWLDHGIHSAMNQYNG